MTKQGMSVSAQFVSTVLSNAKKKGGVVGKRGLKTAKAKSMQRNNVLNAALFVDQNDPSTWLQGVAAVTDTTALQFALLEALRSRLHDVRTLRAQLADAKAPAEAPAEVS